MAQYNGTLSSDFTDVLLLGRTGQGKSTLARKLKNCVVSATRNQPWEEFESNHSKFVNEDPSGVTNDGESATEACVLLSNEKSRLRVLDTPGFAYGNKLDKSFWILQSILEQQEEKKLAFGRVLYFLPQRGPLERADGTLQEEIQLIQNFLGDEVFNVMVVIVTNSYKKGKPETKMDKDDIEKTKLAFSRSMENITTMKCPPIIYLPYLQKDVTAILSVTVLNDIPIRKPLIVRFEGPATEAKVKEELERNKDVKLEFHEKCQKCSTVVIYSENSKGKVPTRAIIKKERGSLMVSYKSSKCHLQ
jgi:GTP-binding protein EngB required for normal cell division